MSSRRRFAVKVWCVIAFEKTVCIWFWSFHWTVSHRFPARVHKLDRSKNNWSKLISNLPSCGSQLFNSILSLSLSRSPRCPLSQTPPLVYFQRLSASCHPFHNLWVSLSLSLLSRPRVSKSALPSLFTPSTISLSPHFGFFILSPSSLAPCILPLLPSNRLTWAQIKDRWSFFTNQLNEASPAVHHWAHCGITAEMEMIVSSTFFIILIIWFTSFQWLSRDSVCRRSTGWQNELVFTTEVNIIDETAVTPSALRSSSLLFPLISPFFFLFSIGSSISHSVHLPALNVASGFYLLFFSDLLVPSLKYQNWSLRVTHHPKKSLADGMWRCAQGPGDITAGRGQQSTPSHLMYI